MAQETINWRLQTAFSPTSMEYTQLAVPFTEQVEKMSNGALKIKPFPAGAIVGAGEAFDATSNGTIDMTLSWLVYLSGKDKALRAVNEWPAMVDPLQGVSWFYGEGAPIMRDIVKKHNLYFLGVSPLAGEHIWSKVEITGVDDLKGVKIRAGGLAADSFASLGASVVKLPGSQIYQGLLTGMIDAAEYTANVEHFALGFQEVTKYVIDPSYSGGGTTDWVVNLEKWDALPDNLKTILESAVRSVSMQFWANYSAADAAVTKKLADGATTLIEWSPEDMERLETERYLIMRDRYSAENEEFAEKFNSQMKFLEGMGYPLPQ
jgi:TRAP-type mannitol/chloroaromatic compound transport system substrate-binding protein